MHVWVRLIQAGSCISFWFFDVARTPLLKLLLCRNGWGSVNRPARAIIANSLYYRAAHLTTSRVHTHRLEIFATVHTLCSSSQLELKVEVFHVLFCVFICSRSCNCICHTQLGKGPSTQNTIVNHISEMKTNEWCKSLDTIVCNICLRNYVCRPFYFMIFLFKNNPFSCIQASSLRILYAKSFF